MKKQNGFTIVELIITVTGILAVTGVVIVAVHFIAKFW